MTKTPKFTRPLSGFKKTTALLFCLFAGFQLRAQFAGGSGTSADPYKISTPAQLDAVHTHLGSNFILTQNIDLTTYLSSGNPGYNGGAGWSPIGDETTKFTGSFDGRGFKISGLQMNSSGDYAGLFGYVSGTTIKNLGVLIASGKTISGAHTIGGLAGCLDGGSISNCYVTGNIKAVGASGSNGSYGESCVAGGLVGYQKDGSITTSYTSGSVSSTGGYGSSGVNMGSMGGAGGSGYAGGLVGWAGSFGGTATISDCYSLSGIYAKGGGGGTGAWSSGGWGGSGGSGGSAYAGGLVATLFCDISNCYSAGSVSGGAGNGGSPAPGGSTGSNGGNYVGGLIGSQDGGNITALYYDNTIFTGAGVGGNGSSQIGVTGRNTAQMQTKTTFTNAGWDFNSIWSIAPNNYPVLKSMTTGITTLPTGPQAAFTLSPNPAATGSTVSITANYAVAALQGAMIQVTDMTGKVLNRINNVQPSTQVTIPENPGIYVITLMLNTGEKTSMNLLVK